MQNRFPSWLGKKTVIHWLRLWNSATLFTASDSILLSCSMMCPTTAAFIKIHLASLPLLSRHKALRHFLDYFVCPDVGVSNSSKLSYSFSSKSEYPRLLFKPQADSPNYVLQKWMRAIIYLGGKALCLPWMTLLSYSGQGGELWLPWLLSPLPLYLQCPNIPRGKPSILGFQNIYFTCSYSTLGSSQLQRLSQG